MLGFEAQGNPELGFTSWLQYGGGSYLGMRKIYPTPHLDQRKVFLTEHILKRK